MTTPSSSQFPPTTRRSISIAESVSGAWHRSHCSDQLDIAVGTVAALAINPLKETIGHGSLAARFRQLDNAGTADALREIWGRRWLSDPYLVQVALPLHGWLEEDPSDETLRAVRGVIDAALRAGLLDLVGHVDPARRSSEDVLGTILTHMRSVGARKGLGEYHTPPDVADLIAQLANERLPEPGQSIAEPCAGSGGLIRAAAQNIRRLGGDPADYQWVMGDIDSLAVACAASNAIIWGLGRRVLVYRADALAEPDAPMRAAATRTAVLEHHHRVVTTAMPVAVMKMALTTYTEGSCETVDDDAA